MHIQRSLVGPHFEEHKQARVPLVAQHVVFDAAGFLAAWLDVGTEQVFERFVKLNTFKQGTGLGLSMTHDIVVKQHGGRIDVETMPGEFTEFVIVLPRSDNVIGVAAATIALLYWQLRKQKIFTPQPGWLAFLLRLIIAVLVMAAALLGVMHLMPEWSQGTMPFRLMRLLVVVVAGVVAYFATLLVLGFRVKEFARRTA